MKRNYSNTKTLEQMISEMNRIADEKKPYLKPKQFRGKKGKVKQYGK